MSSEHEKKRPRIGGDAATSPSSALSSAADGAPTPAAEQLLAQMHAMLEKNCAEMAQMKRDVTSMKVEQERAAALHRSEMESMQQRLSRVEELESRCKFLEARCDSLDRTVQLLSKDEKWEHPPFTKPQWARDADIALLPVMRYQTSSMRRGTYYEHSIILGWGREDLLFYDEVALDHWAEWANAVQLSHHFDGSGVLSINNVELSWDVLEKVTSALMAKRFSQVTLRGELFGETKERNQAGVDFVIGLVQSNPVIEEVKWADNGGFFSIGDFNRLIDGIKCHPTLASVVIENCDGYSISGYDMLCSALIGDAKYTNVTLGLNGIRTMGGTHLPDYIAENPPLRELNLESNHLDDGDAALIASALKHNTNLRSLNLCENNIITDTGWDCLKSAIYNDSCLSEASKCNHYCRIYGYLDSYWNNKHNCPKHNRAEKVYSILNGRHLGENNALHMEAEFGDDSLKFVPHVLECVHRYALVNVPYSSPSSWNSLKAKPLSILYEILQSWNMPDLYERGN